MELRNLKTFQVVAEQLNLSKAAKILKYTQPTITFQIQALEKEIGHPLFDRVGKKTFLTPAGNVLKQYTDQLFNIVSEMEIALQQLHKPSGKLRIAAPEYFCTHQLAQFIRPIYQQYPEVQLELISCSSKEAIQLVHDYRTDLAIIAGPCDSDHLETVLLAQEDMVLITTQENVETHGKIGVHEVLPFITFRGDHNLKEVIWECLDQINYQPRSIIESSSEETIKRAILNHAGLALLSTNTVQSEIESGHLTVLKTFKLCIHVYMIYLKNRSKEVNITSFSNLLQNVFKSIK
ncbi:LysR family transcriptional regulator [Thermoflavimicrobium daqui]|uniref:LysR family transcriptional regulator n=1 Tax=Thermoflavimicrobium daqui TaxID=2137476 RepID=A0A364K4K1_9BACL|nr:LysR family transcriptional regulator [Thermoflavimicrobium daqui]RAL24267.1 LysR family transcriptional regulator [Thermoflavimicrobium daqui]